jgi:hypothetical protein
VFHRPAIAVPSMPHLCNHVRSGVRSDLDLHFIASTSQTRRMLLVWRRRRCEEFGVECKKSLIVCTCRPGVGRRRFLTGSTAPLKNWYFRPISTFYSQTTFKLCQNLSRCFREPGSGCFSSLLAFPQSLWPRRGESSFNIMD